MHEHKVHDHVLYSYQEKKRKKKKKKEYKKELLAADWMFHQITVDWSCCEPLKNIKVLFQGRRPWKGNTRVKSCDSVLKCDIKVKGHTHDGDNRVHFQTIIPGCTHGKRQESCAISKQKKRESWRDFCLTAERFMKWM